MPGSTSEQTSGGGGGGEIATLMKQKSPQSTLLAKTKEFGVMKNIVKKYEDSCHFFSQAVI